MMGDDVGVRQRATARRAHGAEPSERSERVARPRAQAHDAIEGYENDLSVLFPDRQATVTDPDTGAAVTLTVREFRFREGLEATALARPLIAALAGLVPDRAEDEGPDALAVEGTLATHAGLWLELAARACSRDAAWLARLSDADGRALSEAMWAANGGFFLRRVAAQVAARTTAREVSPCHSTACSTPSSAPATDAAMPTSASA